METVEKDYINLHVAKFDCSIFRPICEGIGVEDYPSLVWMNKGKIVDIYKGKYDVESLKTYVFEKMKAIKSSTDAIKTFQPDRLTTASTAISTKLLASDITTLNKFSFPKSSKRGGKTLTPDQEPQNSSNFYSSENKISGKDSKISDSESYSEEAEGDDGDEGNSDQSGAKLNLLNMRQESSDGSNSTEMEEIISLEKSEKVSSESENISAFADIRNIEKPKVIKVVKSSSNKAGIIELTAANYTSSLNPIGVTLVMMYAPWCHFCDDMRKILKSISLKHQVSTLITIGEIDCVNKSNEELCFAEKMQGIPTLNIYREEKLLLNDYKGKTFEDINDCIVSHLTDKGIAIWKQREADRLKNEATRLVSKTQLKVKKGDN